MKKVIRIFYRHDEDDGAWIATSPDVAGYVGHGNSYREARERTEEGLPWYADEPDLLMAHVVLSGDEFKQARNPALSFSMTRPAQPQAKVRYSTEFAQAAPAK